jgi:hypothetical protein
MTTTATSSIQRRLSSLRIDIRGIRDPFDSGDVQTVGVSSTDGPIYQLG